MEATARTRRKSSIFILLLLFLVLCTLASISAAAPVPTPSQAGGGKAGGQAQCLYVTNTGNGRLQVIDVATARPLPFWTLESSSGSSSSSATPSPSLSDEGITSPSATPLSEEERLVMGANQTGLTVGKNPTGLWIEHPYLFISYKWQGHISIYDLNKGLELVGRIENQKLLWCWSGQIGFSRDILYVTCIDDLQIHRFRWEGPDRSLLNFTILSSIPTLRPTYGLKYSNKTDNTSALLVSTPSANTVYLLNTSSPTAATELQPFVQQPEPVVSYSGIETRFDTLYVIDGTNSFVRYFSMSDPNISGIFIDFSVEANNTLVYQLSDFVDLEFGNYNATTGQPSNLFITSQRSDRIELFDADGKYLGPFLVGKEDGTTISEPQNLFFHSCPVLSYPQMNSQNAGKSEGFNIDLLLGLLVPLVAILILLVFVFPLALFFIYSYRNRRRTFDPMDEEEMGGTQPDKERRKYVYREIEPTDLTLGDILGVGAFGKVYQGCWRGGPVAVKVFDTVKLSEANDDVIDEIRKEAEMMEKLGNHPSVISFVGAITRPSEHFNGVALVTEYCSRGSLFELLVKGRARVPPALLVRMARDAAAGIRHLHRERIIHRDIAARNVLVSENYNAYIADFGLARVLKGDTDTTNSNFGPVRWMAPEAMVRREYSEASDAFSFGVLLWEMVTRKVPWRGVDSSQIIIAVAQKNTRLKIPKGCDPILRKIMKGVWKENPRQRMTMAQVLQTLTDYYSILAQYEAESDCDAATDSESESVWGTSGERQARSRSAGDPADGCGKDEKCNSDEGGARVAATDSAVALVPRLRPAQLVQRRVGAAGSDAFHICSPLSPRRHRRHHRPREAEARELRAEVRSDSWEVYTCSLPPLPSSASPPQALDPIGTAAYEKEDEDEDDNDDEQKTESDSEYENENEAGRERQTETETEDEVCRESSGDTQLSPITPRFALDESVEVYTSLTVPATKRRRCTVSDGFLEQQPEQ